MKNLIGVLFLATVFFAVTPASAQAQGTGHYLAPKLFWSHLTGDVGALGDYSDSVVGGALAFGHNFYDGGFDAPVRLEIEAAFRADGKYNERYTIEGIRTDEKYEIGVTSIFANAYFDLYNQTDFAPYIGGGVGAARIKGKVTAAGWYNGSASVSSWDFAWNVGAGVAYNLTPTVALDLGYRYADFGTLTFSNVDLIDVTGHEVLLGGRFTF